MSWKDVVGIVGAQVLDNAARTSERLTELGIPHAVIGGVAVGVLGYPRATEDIDFLIGREGEGQGNAHGFSDEVFALYDKDVIDFLTVRHQEPDNSILLDALAHAQADAEHIPVVGRKELVWLKLNAGRDRDLHDIRRLLEVHAIDAADVLDWLELHDHTGDKVETFSELVSEQYG